VVREAFVHDAVVAMQPGGSPEALGGAITIALCGHWEHPRIRPDEEDHAAHLIAH